MKKTFFLFCILILYMLSSSGMLYALGDGSPGSSIDLPRSIGFLDFQKERGESLVITGGIEDVMKKPLEDDDAAVSARIEGNWYFAGLGYRINDQFEPYIRFGGAEMDIFWTENSQQIEVDGALGAAVGAGIKAMLYQYHLTNLAKLKLNVDGQVRYTTADIDTITIDKVARSVSSEDFSIFEGKVAVTLGFEIALTKITDQLKEWAEEDEEERPTTQEESTIYLVPYGGVVVGGSLVDAEFTYNSTLYQITDIDDKRNIHVIGGLDMIAPKFILLNIETQLLDGEAISGGLSIKF